MEFAGPPDPLATGGRLVACRRSYELLAGGCALGFGFFTLGGRLGVLSPIVQPPMLVGSPVGPPDLLPRVAVFSPRTTPSLAGTAGRPQAGVDDPHSALPVSQSSLSLPNSHSDSSMIFAFIFRPKKTLVTLAGNLQ